MEFLEEMEYAGDIPEGWKWVKLGDVVTLQRGYDLPKSKMEKGNIPVVGSNGIIGYHNKATTKAPGITIGRSGNIGNVYLYKSDFWAHNTTLYVKDFKENDVIFLFYLLKNIDFKQLNAGSAVPTLNRNHIYPIEVKIPIKIEEQKAIAEVLSSIDDKIELLHCQNKTLEEMAMTLFRQWFIEPTEDGLPDGWEEVKIGDVLDVVLGGTPSTKVAEYWNGDIPWINSGEINNFRIVKATKYITASGLKNSNTKLMPKGTTVLAITGATLGKVSLLEIDTCANQSVVGIIPNDIFPKEYIYLWIKYKIDEIILNETGGAQAHINQNDVKNTAIIKPTKEYLNERNKKLRNIFSKITNNVFQIQTLEKLRDTLLPKLMSGEIRVRT
jgi:type I restriction enzyme S subunit